VHQRSCGIYTGGGGFSRLHRYIGHLRTFSSGRRHDDVIRGLYGDKAAP
jgi:hypothetical protein